MLKNRLQITCQKIISGGQTGVDRGTLDACLTNKFNHGGWCPKGRLAEDGKIDTNHTLIIKMITFIQNNKVSILNVAGPRESEWKEGYKFALQLISELIKEIQKTRLNSAGL